MDESAYLIDSNVWIALTFNSHPGHSAASRAVGVLTAEHPGVFCRATQQSFLRLLSTAALTEHYGAHGFTNDDALELLERFMAASSVGYRDEPPGLFPLWKQLAARPTSAPRSWMDAYLAAFAIAGGMTLITLDKGFAAFEKAGLSALIL